MSIAVKNEPPSPMTRMYRFTLVLGGISDLTEDMAESLYESGCDDAVCGVSNGQPYVSFDRESTSLVNALVSAIRQIEGIGYGVKVLEVKPPDIDDIDFVNMLLRLRAGKNASIGEEAWQSLVKKVVGEMA